METGIILVMQLWSLETTWYASLLCVKAIFIEKEGGKI